MRKRVFVLFALSFILSACSLSFRKIEVFLFAPDANEIFVRIPVEIISGYELAQLRNKSGFVVSSPPRRAPDGMYIADTLASQIRRIGWNNDFIVIEEQEETQKVWKIIIVKTEHVYDCIERIEIDMCKSYDEFKSLRTQIGVPDDVELRNVVDVYEELNTHR